MFALLLLAAAADPGEAAVPAKPPMEAVARVVACGFATARIQFDTVLDEEVVAVESAPRASDDQIRCVARASIETDYFVMFPSPVQEVYQPYFWELKAEHGRAAARAWVAQHGLAARLPPRELMKTDEVAFARQLEALCGSKLDGALVPKGGYALLRRDAFEALAGDDGLQTCLTNVASAANYDIAFIGNEADKAR